MGMSHDFCFLNFKSILGNCRSHSNMPRTSSDAQNVDGSNGRNCHDQ